MNLSLTLQNLILPILMIILGLLEVTIFAKNRELNFGYRTHRSKLNDRTWEYSQTWMGKTFIIAGFIFLILGLIISMIIKVFSIELTYIFNIALVIVTIISSFFLEKNLKTITNHD